MRAACSKCGSICDVVTIEGTSGVSPTRCDGCGHVFQVSLTDNDPSACALCPECGAAYHLGKDELVAPALQITCADCGQQFRPYEATSTKSGVLQVPIPLPPVNIVQSTPFRLAPPETPPAAPTPTAEPPSARPATSDIPEVNPDDIMVMEAEPKPLKRDVGETMPPGLDALETEPAATPVISSDPEIVSVLDDLEFAVADALPDPSPAAPDTVLEEAAPEPVLEPLLPSPLLGSAVVAAAATMSLPSSSSTEGESQWMLAATAPKGVEVPPMDASVAEPDLDAGLDPQGLLPTETLAVPEGPEGPETKPERFREPPTSVTRARAAALEEVGPPLSQKARFRCLNTDCLGQEFVFEGAQAIIGRSHDAALRVMHKSVSRHHAQLVPNGHSLRLVDLHSANGTLVNGESLDAIELRRGDVVEVGEVRLRVLGADDPPGAYDSPEISSDAVAARPSESEPKAASSPKTPGPASRPRRVGARTSWPKGHPKPWLTGAIAAVVLAVIGLGAAASTGKLSGTPDLGKLLAAWIPGVDSTASAGHHGSARDEPVVPKDLADAIKARRWDEAWRLVEEAHPEPELEPVREHVRWAFIRSQTRHAREALARGDLAEAKAIEAQLHGVYPPDKNSGALAEEITRAELQADPEPLRLARSRKSRGRNRKAKTATRLKDRPMTLTSSTVGTRMRRSSGKKAPALYQKAVVALNRGDLTTADRYLRACVQSNPNHCLCFRSLGIVNARQGHSRAGASAYRRYLALCPDADDAAEVRALLKNF